MDNFNGYLYKRLPQLYRDNDRDLTLKRFLEVFEIAYGDVFTETEKLLELINVDKCPEEYIPLLCESLGVNYEPDIPVSYQRRFLKNAVALNKRKGTLSAIKYLSRELFGREAQITVEGRVIQIYIEDKIGNLGPYSEKSILERYIKYYLPVFFTLETIFYMTLPSAPLKMKIGTLNGIHTTIFPKKIGGI